jgi:hypothetical protein
MPWLARDKDGKNVFRLFGNKPIKAFFVSYGGELLSSFTWTLPTKEYTNQSLKSKTFTYNPLSNTENTIIDQADCPVYLEPGEGPVEVQLVLKEVVKPRTFEGAYI